MESKGGWGSRSILTAAFDRSYTSEKSNDVTKNKMKIKNGNLKRVA